MDDIIFSEGEILIDKSLIRIGESTFSVASIGSISIKTEKTGTYGFCAFSIVVISIYLITISWIIAIIFLLISLGVIENMNMNKYVILVKNSSGDQPILTLKENDKAQRIKQAIEEALRLRA